MPRGAPSHPQEGTMKSALLFFNWREGQRVEWVTEMLNQVSPDRDRCCWEWRCISGGFGPLLHHQSKELPAVVTAKSSTLRGVVWPGVSPCPDRSTLEYLLSSICSGAWSTYLFTWQRESSISSPSHLGMCTRVGMRVPLKATSSLWFGQLLERKGAHGKELCYVLWLLLVCRSERTLSTCSYSSEPKKLKKAETRLLGK